MDRLQPMSAATRCGRLRVVGRVPMHPDRPRPLVRIPVNDQCVFDPRGPNKPTHPIRHGSTAHQVYPPDGRGANRVDDGMRMVLREKAYPSQECPRCGYRHKPRGRVDPCSACGLRFPRDGVGASVMAMASPTGIRRHPDGWLRQAYPGQQESPAHLAGLQKMLVELAVGLEPTTY
jgi:hypothetical protein